MPSKLLNQQVAGQVKDVFKQLQQPVEVLFFNGRDDCEYCEDTRQLLREVVELSDRLSVKEYDLQNDASIAEQYRVDKAPGFVVVGRDGDQILDYGVRFSGIPSGHEFSSLIHTLILVSNRDSGLSQKTRDALKEVKKPVHLQVFVTPT